MFKKLIGGLFSAAVFIGAIALLITNPSIEALRKHMATREFYGFDPSIGGAYEVQQTSWWVASSFEVEQAGTRRRYIGLAGNLWRLGD